MVADWAAAAERAGWDGFFLWDHLFAFEPGAGRRPAPDRRRPLTEALRYSLSDQLDSCPAGSKPRASLTATIGVLVSEL